VADSLEQITYFGSVMIDISLWRAVIGGWIFKQPIKEKNIYCGIDQMMDATMSYGIKVLVFHVYYVL